MAVVSWLSNDNEVTKNKIRDDNIAPIELNASSASKTYTVGKRFVLDSDGKLYKATQQINQGSAIITSGANANCEEVTEKVLDSLGTASTKNSTSVVTESTDLVESGAVYTALQSKMSYADNGVLGAKNLLDITATTGETRDVTFTVNERKEIATNGTSSGEGTFYIVGANSTDLISIPDIWKGKAIRLTGCPSGGGDNSYRIRFAERSPSTIWHDDTGNGVEFTLNENTIAYNIHIQFVGNVDLTGKVFKPMICLASDKDTTYQPPAQTNRELTVNKCDNSVIGTVEDVATASQAYAVGSHAIRNGAFITWKNAKAQGETINDASDYTNGDISALNSAIDFSGDCNNLADGYVYYTSGGSHAPSNYCIIQTISNFGNTVKTQKAVHVAGGDNIVYIRSYVSGSGWSSWYKFEGTIVS